MASKITDQEIIRAGGQYDLRTLSPEQRRIARYARSHPGATLAEARRGGPEYSRKDLAIMAATTPWEDLTPHQRRLVKGIPDEPITPGIISYHTGIPESYILRRINRKQDGGINISSLVFKGSRGFYGRTNNGNRQVIFYIVRSRSDSEDFFAAFGTAGAIELAVKEEFPCPSPPCDDEDDAAVAIPLKEGAERDNLPESAKEIQG